MLCKLNNTPFDNSVLSASLHDIRRKGDKGDERHGERAANWFKLNYNNLIGTMQDPVNFDEDLIYQGIKYHDIPEKDIPKNIYKNNETIINILKAADALDRFRLPLKRWWPNPEFINLNDIDKFFPVSKYFVYLSEFFYVGQQMSQVDSVFKASNLIGLTK